MEQDFGELSKRMLRVFAAACNPKKIEKYGGNGRKLLFVFLHRYRKNISFYISYNKLVATKNFMILPVATSYISLIKITHGFTIC